MWHLVVYIFFFVKATQLRISEARYLRVLERTTRRFSGTAQRWRIWYDLPAGAQSRCVERWKYNDQSCVSLAHNWSGETLRRALTLFPFLSPHDQVSERVSGTEGVLIREKELLSHAFREFLFGHQLLGSFLSVPIWGLEEKTVRKFRAQKKKAARQRKRSAERNVRQMSDEWGHSYRLHNMNGREVDAKISKPLLHTRKPCRGTPDLALDNHYGCIGLKSCSHGPPLRKQNKTVYEWG